MKNKKGEMEKIPVYSVIIFFYNWNWKDDDTIAGIINVKLGNSKKLDHTGIKVELIGHIG